MKKISFLFIMLVILCSCSSSNKPENSGNNEITDPRAAPDFTLQTLSGDTVSLSQYRGNVVYIFFVGYNCPPCIGSAPITETIYQNYRDKNFDSLIIDVWDGNPGEVAGFRSKTGVTYPVCLDGSITGSKYGVTNDYSVIVDKEGRMKYRSAGVSEDRIIEVLDALLL